MCLTRCCTCWAGTSETGAIKITIIISMQTHQEAALFPQSRSPKRRSAQEENRYNSGSRAVFTQTVPVSPARESLKLLFYGKPLMSNFDMSTRLVHWWCLHNGENHIVSISRQHKAWTVKITKYRTCTVKITNNSSTARRVKT